MEDEWIMVRIRRATRARLEAVRASMLLASEIGAKPVELDDRDRMSLSKVIDLLIDMREGHARRRKRAAGRRRRGRPARPSGDQVDGLDATEVLCRGHDPDGETIAPSVI